ncbi:MAG: DUF2339 domain-containing protein [Paludibacter sp.]|nr:DUF2339 domain-containing protein [Paludibacter sp.]
MGDNTDQLNELLSRLNSLTRKQEEFAREISYLRQDMLNITSPSRHAESTQPEVKSLPDNDSNPEKVIATVITQKPAQNFQYTPPPSGHPEYKPAPEVKNRNCSHGNMEKLIGENLISKIGIAILVLGVAIGTKYAIEHELISPLTRIIMGYLVGLGLLGFAMKLKKKYDNFSAVLLSGAMAILYFITFAAYNFFGLIPQALTFALMVLFTIFTVVASLNYNKQVIAHIGLVGAYAVPFLLSDGSGKVIVLYSYMAIINVGILVLAFRKYWKSLNYVAFALTWIIFNSWYLTSYQASNHFFIASVFLLVFFISFYVTFLAYKLAQKEKFDTRDTILILANSFIFYGLGYAIIDSLQTGNQYLGLFTLGNALLHFGVSTVIYKQKLGDRNLFYLVSGLVLVFIAIAIPVQLDGNWVTLLWAGEAALLFWIGRTKKVEVYEGISYALMGLAFLSIFQDWLSSSNYVNGHPVLTDLPFINIQFLSSLLFIAAFGFIIGLNRNKKYPSAFIIQKDLLDNFSNILQGLVLLTIYVTFFNEIATGFDQAYLKSEGNQMYDYSIISFKTIWLINYSLLFTSLLCYVNLKWIKKNSLGNTALMLTGLAVLIFLTVGLYSLSELRDSYLKPSESSHYISTVFNLIIRYVCYAFVALAFVTQSLYLKVNTVDDRLKKPFPILLHATILWILSSELINWMDIAGSSDSYKLGITILWGVYSLAMIVLGIWKKNKDLRITAIVLFGVTLAKLFLYDIANLNTISKTIVLVSLGIMLLIISFLYNKYKLLIFDEDEE